MEEINSKVGNNIVRIELFDVLLSSLASVTHALKTLFVCGQNRMLELISTFNSELALKWSQAWPVTTQL